MRKYIFTAIAAFALSACHESLEDKTERETKEFTAKECPRKMPDGVTIDSMVFERATRTVHYYFTLSGKADTTAIDQNVARTALLNAIKGDMSTRKHKENGYSFAYTYFSTKHKGQKLIDMRFTKKDYESKTDDNKK